MIDAALVQYEVDAIDLSNSVLARRTTKRHVANELDEVSLHAECGVLGFVAR